jgi:hypothetical protein
VKTERKIKENFWVAWLHECPLMGLDSFFRKNHSSYPKNEPVSQKMRLKVLLLSRGLKWSNAKPGCGVSAYHLFVK